MSENPVDLKWIGATLRSIQAEQRTIRMENARNHGQMEDVLRVIVDRIAQFEARMETRMDQLEAALGREPGSG